jgi:hypothetical protein
MRGATEVDFGDAQTTPSMTRAAVIAAFEPSGAFAWARRLERADIAIPARPSAIAVLSDGSAIVAGVAGAASQPMVDYTLETSAGLVTVGQMAGNDSFVMRLTAGGDLAWFRRIDSNVEAISPFVVVDETSGAAFVMGFALGVTFDEGLPSEIHIARANGWYLVRLSADTGEAVWGRTQVSTEGGLTANAPSVRADGLYWPMRFIEVDFGAGPVRKASDVNGWASVRYQLDGTYVGCGDVVDTPQRVSFD